MDKIFNNVIDFNGDISKWDVSRVTTMIAFFAGATSFHGDLSKWDASSVVVVDVSSMFWRVSAFDGDLSKWDVSSVNNMGQLFLNANYFDRDFI